MTAEEVLKIYNDSISTGIQVWIDGGWCVDALVGEQTREHADLDVAVARRDESKLRILLGSEGFVDLPRADSSAWNFALQSGNQIVDIHVFEFDQNKFNAWGVEYPFESLSGTGMLAGQQVQCISPEWMFKFKTAYPPADKDKQDVQRLAAKFGFKIPASHQ
ncbi:MAG TPA: hypothetical protein VG604_01305 [Candidatus Saccharimonadales bacterium]|nr:hypothetical protein [Candidatus Saccharimonadales bacterium]